MAGVRYAIQLLIRAPVYAGSCVHNPHPCRTARSSSPRLTNANHAGNSRILIHRTSAAHASQHNFNRGTGLYHDNAMPVANVGNRLSRQLEEEEVDEDEANRQQKDRLSTGHLILTPARAPYAVG